MKRSIREASPGRGRTRRSISLGLAFTLALLVLPAVGGMSGVAIAADPVNVTATYVDSVNTWEWASPAPDPSGVAWLGGNTLLVSDSEIEEVTLPACSYSYSGTNLWEYNISTGVATAVGTSVAYSNEPTGIGPKSAGVLLMSDDDADEIDTIDDGADGTFGTGDDSVTSTIDTSVFSSDNEGVAWDSKDGTIFYVSGEPPNHSKVYRLNTAGAKLSEFEVPSGPGLSEDSQGIAYHAGRDTLLVTDDSNQIFEVDKFGTHISTMQVNPPNGANNPGHTTSHTLQGIAIVPGGGNTYRLFIADRRADPGNPPTVCNTNLNDGQIHEFTVTLPDDRTPSVNIVTPITGTSYSSGQTIAFTGTATDETGNLTAGIVWSSNRDGQIGTGGSFNTAALSAGTHTITASSTANGETGTDTITLTVAPLPGGTSLGIVRGNTWFVNNGGLTNTSFAFGKATDRPIAGDWDGNGTTTPGLVRGNVWFLSNQVPPTSINHQFAFGKASDRPVVGDWDGNGTVTPGVVRGNVWYLSNQNPPQTINYQFAFGSASDFPVVGDWDGDGDMTPGLVRGNVWFLSNQVAPQTINHQFAFGKASDYPVVGDWDGDDDMTPGLVRGNVWFLSNQATPQTLQSFVFGKATDFPIAGNWDGVN